MLVQEDTIILITHAHYVQIQIVLIVLSLNAMNALLNIFFLMEVVSQVAHKECLLLDKLANHAKIIVNPALQTLIVMNAH